MRINHNIASLNTYRQLTSNSVNGSKSLEKLSSGLRINRAGDDAAGLAISEKMRAQIRGLDQASRNAQDGISMIQTAEGALAESHSILQRMRELANQAANDTNVGVDRSEIQKEINQLSSEINRIGNTTEFNTQKLLDGGRQIKTNATLSGAKLTGGVTAADTNITIANKSVGVIAEAPQWVSGNIALDTEVADADVFTFGGVTVTIDVDAGYTTGDFGSGTLNNGAVTLHIADADKANATAIRDALVTAFTAIANEAGSAIEGITFAAGAGSSITANGTTAMGDDNNAFTFASPNGHTFGNAGAAAQLAAGNAGVDGVNAGADFVLNDANAPEEGSYLMMADKKVAFYDSGAATFANENDAKAAMGADFVVDVSGKTQAQIATYIANNVSIAGFTLSVPGGGGAGDRTVTMTSNTPGIYNGANLAYEVSPATDTAATGSFTFSATPTEGSSISIGGKTIGLYDSSLENYKTDTAAKAGLGTDFAVDIKGLSTSQVVDKIMTLESDLNAVLTSDVSLGKTTNDDGSINLVVNASTDGYAGNNISIAASSDSSAGFKATLQIGANSGQSFQLNVVDMRSNALKITGKDANNLNVTASNGKVASYTQTTTVSNGTDNNNSEFALDVSTHEKATAAISVINDAIEAVSSERSKLGAYQNRLEHTINNLGTSSENLTASESRIRDVDMAKEMMEFTKNNILSQAAQAMLAQANQQPQGVLQLLR